MDPTSRQLLQDIQREAGVSTMEETYGLEDYPSVLMDPVNQDDSWFDNEDDSTPPPEVVNVVEAARTLRLHMYVSYLIFSSSISYTNSIFCYFLRVKGHHRVEYRTWKERRYRELQGWETLIDRLARCYMEWKYTPSSAVSNATTEYPYTVSVFEIFTMEHDITVYRPPTSDSPAIDLALHGFLAKTPVQPTVAIGFRTLALFHSIRLRKASMSVEAFTRVICDYYGVSPSMSPSPSVITYVSCILDSFSKVPPHRSSRHVRGLRPHTLCSAETPRC